MRGKELFEKLTDIDNDIIIEAEKFNRHKKIIYMKRIIPAACIVLLLLIIPLSNLFLKDINQEKDSSPYEVCFEFNNKIYSVVNTPKSPAYNNYDLEESINSDIIGEYLGEMIVQINSDNKDTYKLYRYVNAPITDYDWVPRMIAQSSEGHYYHALIGSCFDEDTQTADEILSVYGITSSDSIVYIENKKGKKVTDKAFIKEFYNGLFTKKYGGNDLLQENVYQNTGIDESEIDKLYCKYADNMVSLKVKLSNGLVIGVDFTSHNYVRVDNDLYFKVDDSWLDLVSVFK